MTEKIGNVKFYERDKLLERQNKTETRSNRKPE